MPTIEEIKDYYDFSKLDYQIYNLASSDISMHFGLRDEATKTHKEALINENKVIAEIVKLTKNDYVLDVGCGYGTTAIWLAKNIGCRVLGITISDKQVSEAKNLAKEHGVEHLTDFKIVDFHNLTYFKDMFDVVIAIESISHSADKKSVIEQVYKALKVGGRFAVADGFFNKDEDSFSKEERKIAQICFEGVHVPPLAQKKDFEQWISQVGFKDIRWSNKTFNILKTSRRISVLARLFLPISYILKLFGFKQISTAHVKAFIYQYYGWKDGLGVYGIFNAIKQ